MNNETYEKSEYCSNLVCYGKQNITSNYYVFESSKKLYIDSKNDYLIPGKIMNGEFEPIHFEFKSIEENIKTQQLFCEYHKNSFLNTNFPISIHNYHNFKSFYYKRNDLIENLFIKILDCVQANSIENCRYKKKEFSFIDHQILGINCVNKNKLKSIFKSNASWL